MLSRKMQGSFSPSQNGMAPATHMGICSHSLATSPACRSKFAYGDLVNKLLTFLFTCLIVYYAVVLPGTVICTRVSFPWLAMMHPLGLSFAAHCSLLTDRAKSGCNTPQSNILTKSACSCCHNCFVLQSLSCLHTSSHPPPVQSAWKPSRPRLSGANFAAAP